jgi:serine/threonine protein kinase
MSEIPRKASIGDGTIKFFKPALDKSQIIREIDMHSRILNAGLKGKIRVANFHSIVVSKDAKMTIGLLFDLIPSIGESLQSRQCKMASEHHAKWKQQVTAIVKELHSHDIVWGDVHPGNIVIDKNFDAWIVDFGGGWIEDFVDRKKAGTKEGDWQGVQRIFEEWITR